MKFKFLCLFLLLFLEIRITSAQDSVSTDFKHKYEGYFRSSLITEEIYPNGATILGAAFDLGNILIEKKEPTSSGSILTTPCVGDACGFVEWDNSYGNTFYNDCENGTIEITYRVNYGNCSNGIKIILKPGEESKIILNALCLPFQARFLD